MDENINVFNFVVSPTLRTLCNELSSIKYKTFEFGIQLGISYHKLMQFKLQDNFLGAVINDWLCGNVPGMPISWTSIVEALESESVGAKGLAKVLRDKYCCTG